VHLPASAQVQECSTRLENRRIREVVWFHAATGQHLAVQLYCRLAWPVARIGTDEHVPQEDVPLVGHFVEQATGDRHKAAGRVEIDKPGGEDRVEAKSRHEEPRVELPTGPDGSGEDAGSEDGGVVVVVVRIWARREEGGVLDRR
jgi:hypothetical protein